MMDDDILSQGGDHEPGRWPRRLTVIAVLIAVVVGGAAYLGLSRHQHAPAAARPATGTALPSPVIPSSTTALSAPPGPDGITGQTLAWERNLRLLAAGSRPVWFSPASGRSELIAGLPPDRSGYAFTRVNGGWAVQSSSAPPARCGGCAGTPAPVWFLADGARSVTMVGTANLVASAATAGAVWLTSYPRGANMNTAAGTAREAGVTGSPGRPVRLPPGYSIDQGTIRGLLLVPVGGQPEVAYRLWDPSAPNASRTFHGLLAASPGEIAWPSRCAPRCAVQTLDLMTGRHTVLTLPAGSSAVSGAFSPDGRYLALQVSVGNTGDGGELGMQLKVASMPDGRLTAVPGTWVSSDALVGFGWPSRSDSLVAEFSFTTKTQLASWHPGAGRPSVRIIGPGRTQESLILG